MTKTRLLTIINVDFCIVLSTDIVIQFAESKKREVIDSVGKCSL